MKTFSDSESWGDSPARTCNAEMLGATTAEGNVAPQKEWRAPEMVNGWVTKRLCFIFFS